MASALPNSPVDGLHHVTAIASDPAENFRFWTRVLGQRFVKKTVNFDDPGTYHLYYGTRVGAPGTAMTFFPFPSAPRGRHGIGETAATRFSVPPDSLVFWAGWLEKNGAPVREGENRFGDKSLVTADPDGTVIALIERQGDTREPWETADIHPDHAIRGFEGVSLRLQDGARTHDVLTHALGYREAGSEGHATRYVSAGGSNAGTVDLISAPGTPPAHSGAGSVHHVAFAVPDDKTHALAREIVSGMGIQVTPFIDRNYFHSIYFREPGGVLFEIATNNPGFTMDEPEESLGEDLKLPPQHEHLRAHLEATLKPLPQ
ncbi:MAG: ring-cleaving dioxygenase [Tepidamorphaceae bacterium]|nr:ring-cleaving dioxygenase [Rhodobiaceae bacterium]MCC0049029.1 ring-cleaving dioxygenase [Rhodobiaceae bacterium]